MDLGPVGQLSSPADACGARRNIKVIMTMLSGMPVSRSRLFTQGELAQAMLVTDISGI